jgi:hypothetical protein
VNLISHSLCWSRYSCSENTPRSVALICQNVITLRYLLMWAREGRVDRRVINLLTPSHALTPMCTVTPRSIFLFRYAQFFLHFGRHIIFLLTYSMEQSPSWEANRFSVSQENSPYFMEPEGSLPHSQVATAVPILSQLDPVHTPTSHFLKIHLNIILSSAPGSPKWSLSLRFPHQNPVYASPLPPYALHAPPISFF